MCDPAWRHLALIAMADFAEACEWRVEWAPSYLARATRRRSPEGADPIVQEMTAALAPYLEKINAIPELRKDVTDIKVGLNIRPDISFPSE
jgi:hypothetical protein